MNLFFVDIVYGRWKSRANYLSSEGCHNSIGKSFDGD